MSGEIKPVPNGAESLASYQLFLDTCKADLKRRDPNATLDLSQAKVFNRETGDGHFELLYDDPARNFSCKGQWLWESRELLVRGGGRGPGEDKPLGGGWIEDGCAATSLLAGVDEFAGKTCDDAKPGLFGGEQYEGVQQFAQGCQSLLEGQFDARVSSQFDLSHVRVHNEIPGDDSYNLLFESRAKNAFCEAQIDVSTHQMNLRVGKLQDYEKAGAGKTVQLTDACTMTKGLVGERELLSPDCKDMTAGERKQTRYLTYAFYGVGNVLGILATYRLGKKFLASQAMRQLSGLPFVRNLGYGFLGYTAFDEAAGMFFSEDNPIRHYGKWAAGAAGVFGPSVLARTGLATRLAASPVLGRLGGFASRATWGLAAVWGMNYIFHKWVVGDDYEESLNSRVTDKVYHDDGLYDYGFWKCVNPLSWLNKSRRVFRAIAPSAMEWGVTRDNKDLKEKFRQEDRENAIQAQEFLKGVMPLLMHSDNWEELNASIVLLRDEKITLNHYEQILALQIPEGPEAVRDQAKLFGQTMTDQELDDFIRKALCQKVQEAAAFLNYVPGDYSGWAQELFNKDGTLKGPADGNGVYPYQKAQERWPVPPPEKTEETSENFDIAPMKTDVPQEPKRNSDPRGDYEGQGPMDAMA